MCPDWTTQLNRMKNSKKIFALILSSMITLTAMAQMQVVSGKLTGGQTKERPLTGATVILTGRDDNADVKKFTTSNLEGSYALKVPKGKYKMVISFVGYENIEKDIDVAEAVDLGTIRLAVKVENIEEITVQGRATRSEQKGDTTVFSSDAYKVNKNANAEELVQKMPGVVMEEGKVKAQGEEVKKILVDGREFFGDDPNIALKNLPAEMIDRVEVYDQQSDQARLTGFDDGNAVKAINIVTRKNNRQGQFGKVYAGYGMDERYQAGGSVNIFKGNSRISIVAMSNNVNQQNFSSEDIVGLSNSSSSGRGRRSGGGSGGMYGGRSENFMVGGSNGISKTNAIGINYSNSWANKLELNSSYFFNASSNRNIEDAQREYFLSGDSLMHYSDHSGSKSANYNHRMNAKLEYKMDKNNTLIFTPSFSIQDNNSNYLTSSQTFDPRPRLPELTFSQMSKSADQINGSTNDNVGYTFRADMLYQKRFDKQFRSFTIRAGINSTNRDGERHQETGNRYYTIDTLNSQDTVKQRTDTQSKTTRWSASISYTEPVFSLGMIQASYDLDYTLSDIDKANRKYDFTNNRFFDDRDSVLSNEYTSDYLTQRAGLSYRVRNEKLMLSVGGNYQMASLVGNQIFPHRPNVDQTYENFLPNLMMDYRPSKLHSFRLFYRASTSSPGITDLQAVIDNSNPMSLKVGNPKLNQSYRHWVSGRYNYSNPAKGLTFMVGLFGSLVNDYVANATTIASRDMDYLTQGNQTISLTKGQQLSETRNLNGYKSVSGSLTFGFPFYLIKSNINLNTYVGYTRLPGMTNNQKLFTNSTSLAQGIVLGSNISEKMDFTLSYSYRYNIIRNTLQSTKNNNYYTQEASGRWNWEFGPGLIFSTTGSYYNYAGLSDGYNQNYFLLNASFGKKFLKDNRGELKVGVIDALNQNKSLVRNVTDSYYEDVNSLILGRYYMVTFTYAIRNFKMK